VSAGWVFFWLVVVFFAAMAATAGAMFVAWLCGDVDPGVTPREVELDAWIDETLRDAR